MYTFKAKRHQYFLKCVNGRTVLQRNEPDITYETFLNIQHRRNGELFFPLVWLNKGNYRVLLPSDIKKIFVFDAAPGSLIVISSSSEQLTAEEERVLSQTARSRQLDRELEDFESRPKCSDEDDDWLHGLVASDFVSVQMKEDDSGNDEDADSGVDSDEYEKSSRYKQCECRNVIDFTMHRSCWVGFTDAKQSMLNVAIESCRLYVTDPHCGERFDEVFVDVGVEDLDDGILMMHTQYDGPLRPCNFLQSEKAILGFLQWDDAKRSCSNPVQVIEI